jgi:hypothetical protein
MSLIDDSAPNPDAAEFHEIEVNASADVVYRALWTTDLGASLVIKSLLALRSLPAVIRGRKKSFATSTVTLQSIIDGGFGLLAEEPGREILLGVLGRFWRPTGNVEPFDRDSFSKPVPPGMARGLWNFKVVPAGDRETILSTETRVTCGDPTSRRKFRLYWFVIRPFSGLIRIIMLKTIRDAAQARAVESSRPLR